MGYIGVHLLTHMFIGVHTHIYFSVCLHHVKQQAITVAKSSFSAWSRLYAINPERWFLKSLVGLFDYCSSCFSPPFITIGGQECIQYLTALNPLQSHF